MVKIMQENGEVVATLGSSANYHNMQIFLSSDASLAVEPLYPQVGTTSTPSYLFYPQVHSSSSVVSSPSLMSTSRTRSLVHRWTLEYIGHQTDPVIPNPNPEF